MLKSDEQEYAYNNKQNNDRKTSKKNRDKVDKSLEPGTISLKLGLSQKYRDGWQL